MTGRPHQRRAPPATTTDAPPLLDWRDPRHWSRAVKPCRYCGQDTHLRDSKGKPADKVCAEKAIAQQATDAAAAYRKETL